MSIRNETTGIPFFRSFINTKYNPKYKPQRLLKSKCNDDSTRTSGRFHFSVDVKHKRSLCSAFFYQTLVVSNTTEQSDNGIPFMQGDFIDVYQRLRIVLVAQRLYATFSFFRCFFFNGKRQRGLSVCIPLITEITNRILQYVFVHNLTHSHQQQQLQLQYKHINLHFLSSGKSTLKRLIVITILISAVYDFIPIFAIYCIRIFRNSMGPSFSSVLFST